VQLVRLDWSLETRALLNFRPKGETPKQNRCLNDQEEETEAAREETARGSHLGGRPFAARRLTAKLEIDRSDSPPRVRNARSVTNALAMAVHDAIAGVGIGNYSR
jgi:hypothetical protein